MTRIDIVSGFLGAGKTTFIKRLLGIIDKEKTVLIENEFGEVGIDGAFLENAGIEIKEMNSGCICCSLVGDFTQNLKEILETYKPDRLIIEPSGVGKLSDVKRAIEIVGSGTKLHKAITVVDASKCKMYTKNFGEFFNNQIEHADIIVLSRMDIIDPKKIEEVLEIIREINQSARVVTTPLVKLDDEEVRAILEREEDLSKELIAELHAAKEQEHHSEDCGCGGHHHEHEHGEDCGCGGRHHEHEHHHGEDCGCGGHHHEHEHHHGEDCGCGGHHHGHHHHHADEVFESWGREELPKLPKSKLEDILERLSESSEFGVVLRAKGMIECSDCDEWIYFDLVPGEIELRSGKALYSSKLCVIGANLDKEALEKVFSI